MSADNYDDLDDLLDDADLQAKILAKSPSAGTDAAEPDSASAPISDPLKTEKVRPEGAPAEPSKEHEEDLPKELENLLQASAGDAEAQDALKTLLASLSTDDSFAPGEEGEKNPQTFESTISETMDRLNQSQKRNGSNSNLEEADLMEKLLQDMQKSISQDPDSNGDTGGLDGLLSSLLSELSSKEVLYEPLKELHTNYPDWLAKNRDSLEASELARLEKQQSVVAAVITKFEDPKYSDSDKAARDYITEKMMQMQDTGAPPKELVGEVAGGAFPGFPGMGSNASPDLPSDCATQ